MVFPAALMLAGCGGDEGPDIDLESSIPVRVEEVQRKSIREFVFATGTVLAVHNEDLNARQSGYYRLQDNPRTGRPFAMGDAVKTGDVIIILENPEYENQVAYDSKKLIYDISKREFEKQQALYDKGGVTLREVTDAERAFIDARYAFENAQLLLDKLKMVAPFDGALTDLPFYGPGQLVETGSLLAEVMDETKMFSEITLPGKEMERVTRNQKAQITNYTNPDDTAYGVVTQVSPALNPDSRMFKATLEVDNSEMTLRPGMFVKIDIIVKERDSVLVVPKDILLDRRGATVVFVVEKGLAVERRLETGLSNRLESEVISGLKDEERLVVEGFETLRNRSKVKITN
jgi:RND family efflux transporter MFP subunit